MWPQVIKNQDGDQITLSSFQGKSPVVLFFYPKAGTPGCTAQACSFRDAYERFTKAGAKVRACPVHAPARFSAHTGDPCLVWSSTRNPF